MLDTALASLSRKSALAVAIRYSLSRWQALIQLHRRRPAGDDQQRRRARHQTAALGRKNYLFSGSDTGGRRAAFLYTIIETA